MDSVADGWSKVTTSARVSIVRTSASQNRTIDDSPSGGRDRVRHGVHGRVAKRLANRVQMTTDGHKACLGTIEGAFGCDVDCAMLVKI